ncbi:MAG: MBL fold metallo-hydrolase [Paludibacteraceae bacterium]|nr:MBL fold metallo-hydrolase [Paludibacteraceae bacterium]
MRLIRTFHPVGHGAFYTERFYDDSNKCVFTAVYDCGRKLKKKDFENYLDCHLRGEQIDALFISHMHSDHISGIKHLLDHNNCKKIFLPQLTKGQRLALLVQNIVTAIDDESESTPDEIIKEDDAFQTLKWCYSGEGEFSTRIVRVPYIEDSKEGYEDASRNIEECKGTLNKGESVKVPLSTRFDWIYFPMNLRQDIAIDFGDLLNGVTDDDTTENIDFEKLADICKNPDNWKKIVKIYKGAIDDDIANEYSMTVYSGYANSHKAVDVCVHCFCDCDYCCYGRPACYYHCRDIMNPGCLYMGDFVAENKNVNNLIKFYGIYHKNSDVIQVPHHGSRKLKKDTDKYGFQLFDYCRIGVISTQFGLYNGIPAADVIQALKTNRVCPKIITQKNYTRLELRYPLI